MPEIQRPTGRDLTHSNNREFIYLRGNESTDGSLRYTFFPNFTAISLEVRANGVWNLGNSMNSIVCLGSDLHELGLGRFLGFQNVTSTLKSIAPFTKFNDAGSAPAVTVKFSARAVRQIIQADDSTNFITNKIEDDNISPGDGIRDAVYIKTGTVGATEDVTFSLYNGFTESDPRFYQAFYPASLFPANSEVRIPLNPLVDFETGANVHSVIETPGTLSYRGDAGGSRWLALDIQPYIQEELVSLPTGSNKYVSDQFGDFVADQFGNIVFNGPPDGEETL